ncbi:MAG TPA: SdpI family protein [Gemmatimonadales bacterium]
MIAPQTVFPLLGILFVALAWPLANRRIPPNRWYGLRVPATFADKTVWYDANAVTGRDMMTLGAVVTVVAVVLPHVAHLRIESYTLILVALLALGSLVLAIRGWRLANQLLRERRNASG